MGPKRRWKRVDKHAVARKLRRESTPSERYAWSVLRNRRLLGLKFRRQHVLHGFVVDFYCPSLRLVIELEGRVHEDAAQVEYDNARAEYLTDAGYSVVRIPNDEVSEDYLSKIIAPVLRARNQQGRPPSPR